MKKFLASALAVSAIATAIPAFANDAQNTSVTTSTTVTSSADLSCMSAAVMAREDAVIAARTTLNASLLSALNQRRTSLQAAYTISVTKDRWVAINASWKAYVTATKAARSTFNASIKTAWTAYAAANAKCGVTVDPVRKADKNADDDNDDKKFNRGLHLGQLKHMDTKMKIDGDVKLDLSY